jgi:hypothetical protein
MIGPDAPLSEQLASAEELLASYERQLLNFRETRIVPLIAMIDEMRTALAAEEKTDGS